METHKEKLYKLWFGNNKFYLGGLIMIGPDSYRIIITLFLITAPECLFISTVSHSYGPVSTTISIFLYLSTVFLLFLTATSNPGYIPKQDFPFARGPFRSPTIYSALINEPAKPAAIERPYFEHCTNSSRLRLKYCRSCFILRPPRASHCPDCNLCVERFDHHCPWIGSCIGKKNYNIFFSFLSSTIILLIFTLSVSLHQVISINSNNSQFFSEASPGIFLTIYCVFMGIMVGGLFGFHIYLVFNNLTTNEALKRVVYFPKQNPFYRRKVLTQVFMIFCVKRFFFYELRKSVKMDNKGFCTVCTSRDALKKMQNQTDFEITVQIDSPLKPNSAAVYPED